MTPADTGCSVGCHSAGRRALAHLEIPATYGLGPAGPRYAVAEGMNTERSTKGAAMNQTAAGQYRDNQDRIHKAQVRLALLLKAHAKRAAESQGDWSLAGDMGHIAERLEECVAFLSGPVRTYPATDRQGRSIRVTVPEGR